MDEEKREKLRELLKRIVECSARMREILPPDEPENLDDLDALKQKVVKSFTREQANEFVRLAEEIRKAREELGKL